MAFSLQCEALTKRFSKVVAVDDVTFALEPGEIAGFLGPNGAGKTTTMRMAMGFLEPTSGHCRVFGTSALRSPEVRKRIGYVPGDLRLDKSLSGNQLFEWFSRLRSGSPDRGRRDSLVERFELDPTRPFGSLSKGNRQKVGLIQALMHAPELLILDEPTSGLDPLLQRTLLDVVRESARDGAAVLYSSHALQEVEQASDRLLLLRDGRLVESTDIDSLLDRTQQRLQLRFSTAIDPSSFDAVDHVVESQSSDDGRTVTVVVDGSVNALFAAASALGSLQRVRNSGDDLEDLFVSYYEVSRGGD